MPRLPLGKPGAEEAPPPSEERALPFVAKPNPKAVARINREMRQRMYLMGKRIVGDERNPTGVEFYVMGEIGKIFTVKIREFPCCQCGDFLLARLCKHLVFVSSRVLKFNQDDPLIWQRALVPSELERVISNPAVTPVKPKTKFKRLRESLSMGHGPHDILEHAPMYCPVCCEEVNFFEEEVYEREESLLDELYNQNSDKKVTSLKAKLDMGTPKSMIDKEQKDAAPPPETAAAPPPPPPAAPPADSPAPAEGDPSADGQEEDEAAAPSPPEAGGDAPLPASLGATGAESPAAAEGEGKPAEEAQPAQILPGPLGLKPFEPLLFCPKKSCEFEGCVKVVHQYCWLKWGRFHKVEWTLPSIILVNNSYPLASTCH